MTDPYDGNDVDYAHDYHWSHRSIRRFLEELACTGIVTQAARVANMTPRAAYTLRQKRGGLAFRYAWDAAMLIARAAVEAQLMERVMLGEKATITVDESGTRIRHHHNHRLGMALLTRLDKKEEAALQSADHAIIRAAAQDFDCFIELACSLAKMDEIAAFTQKFLSEDNQEIHCELAQFSAAFDPNYVAKTSDDEDEDDDPASPASDNQPPAHFSPEWNRKFFEEHPF